MAKDDDNLRSLVLDLTQKLQQAIQKLDDVDRRLKTIEQAIASLKRLSR